MRPRKTQAPDAQLTVRGVSTELMDRIRVMARKEGWSVNKTVVHLLNEATSTRPVYTDLDDFFGGWTEADAQEFDQTLAQVREIDRELWP